MNLSPPLHWIASAVIALFLAAPAHAMITNGSFESGLAGWSVGGDTGVQTIAIGSAPTDGSNQILLTTIDSAEEPDSNYSGSDAVPFADLETLMGAPKNTFKQVAPKKSKPTEGSGITQAVTGVLAGSTLQLDWNFLTDEASINPTQNDFAVLYIRETTGSGFESTSLLVEVAAATFSASGTPFANETGYQTTSVVLPVTGDYILGIAVFDAKDELRPSALLLDNVAIAAPIAEPGTAALLALGLLGLAWYGRARNDLNRAGR